MERPTERGGTVGGVKEAARLLKMGAPAHPIFVHFTIALTASSLAFDALGFFTGRASLTAAGGWTLVGAASLSLMTILTGLTSAARAPLEEGEARSFLRAHMALGFVFYGLLVAMTLWRLSLWQSGAGVSWWYLAAMAVISLVMTVQGYLGGSAARWAGCTWRSSTCWRGRRPSRPPTARGLWGAQLRRAMLDYNYYSGVGIVGEILPQARNAVKLHETERDQYGLPVPHVIFSYHKNDSRIIRHAAAKMREILEAAGGEDLWSADRTAHLLGTCRMGDDPSDSVVNRDCRAHDVPDLFICDGSVFPTSTAVKPSLTIQAIAARAADRLVKDRPGAGCAPALMPAITRSPP